jgi:nucleotide-binding universal stress UspA family protein
VLEIVTVATLRTDLSLGFSSAVLAFLPYADLAESERRAALRILGAGKRVARRARIHPELRFLERGKRERVAEALARWAVRRRFHLLAIGREGRTAFEDWTVGSVTRRVLSVSRRPVLVVGRRHP